MDGGGDLGPGIVTPGLVNDDMAAAQRVAHQVLAPKLGGHCVLLPEAPLLMLHVHGKHRRVVTNLCINTHVTTGAWCLTCA